MNDLKNRLAALINVKTVVTFAVTAVFVVLAIRKDISPEIVMNIVVMVMSFYFGTQYEKNNQKEEEEQK